MRFAIRRFNSSYGKATHEDSLLDCAIALESLLVSNDRDLSLQFRLHGAFLLNRTRIRSRTFAFLKKLYDFRSKIVHQGIQIPELLKPEESGVSFLDEASQITREVIVAFLERSKSGICPAKVRRSLEGEILRITPGEEK